MSLILIPMAVTYSLEGNFMLLGLVGGISFLLYVFFVLKDAACALPVIGIFIVGKLNFLPFGFTAMAIFTIALILYYFFKYFALQQITIDLGPYFLFIPVLVITAIVVYHNRKLGLHALGSNAEGSRQGLLMLLGAVGYICGVSISPPSSFFLSRLPWYCTIVGVVTSMPDILTTFFPSLAPYLYYLTDAVNVGAYLDAEGIDVGITRAGGLGAVALYLEAFLLAYFPIYTWWRLQRWWVPILFIGTLVMILAGGFRSSLIIFGVIFLLATWCYYSWRSFFILPIAFLGIFALSILGQSGVVELPVSMQRSLSFLPGKWDAAAVDSTEASNDFRENIKKTYIREELYKSPWIGNGFIFDTGEADRLNSLARNSETPDHYYQSKAFIVSKTFHVGWISLYDTIGLVGSAAFIALGIGMIGRAGYFVWRQADHRAPTFPLKVWLFCGITREFVAYFTVFGDIRNSFPTVCAYAIILIQIDRMERGWSLQAAPPLLQKREDIHHSGRVAPQPSLLRPS